MLSRSVGATGEVESRSSRDDNVLDFPMGISRVSSSGRSSHCIYFRGASGAMPWTFLSSVRSGIASVSSWRGSCSAIAWSKMLIILSTV